MEHSSPLAAMQPTSMMGTFFQNSMFRGSQQPCSRPQTFGVGSFNFCDLHSMKTSSSDYFGRDPVRGSSPTASLAADLSQNFHIDKSPEFATPRRSLFTSSLFGTVDGREGTTTPPLPSSSPGTGTDSMDISPLPHKAPYAVMSLVQSTSARANMNSNRAALDSSPCGLPALPTENYRPKVLHERKKTFFSRPSQSRTKSYTNNAVPAVGNCQSNHLPPFRFGGRSKPSESVALSLGECFTESPPHGRKSSLPNPATTPFLALGPPRPRQPFVSVGIIARNGSPSTGHVRKPSAPIARPRKQFRRSLSMFEHPGDVMKDTPTKSSSCHPIILQSIMDVDDVLHTLRLPHFIPEDQSDSLPRISQETLIEVLDGRYREHFDESWVVDCRFEYEYHGGHIEGAINHNDKKLLAEKLFEKRSTESKTLLIFHCEYSAHRAPIMAKFVRGHDRTVNDHRYPQLNYPEIYILDGGYSSFFAGHRGRCFPQNYVEMGAAEHANTCEREMGRLRHRTKLSRAQTFAFGQQGLACDDSPTGPSRVKGDSMMGQELQDSEFDQRRSYAGRVVSY